MPLVLYGPTGPLWSLTGLGVESVDADIVEVFDDNVWNPCGCCHRRRAGDKAYIVRVVVETVTDIIEKSFRVDSLEAANAIMESAILVASYLEDAASEASVPAAPSAAPAPAASAAQPVTEDDESEGSDGSSEAESGSEASGSEASGSGNDD